MKKTFKLTIALCFVAFYFSFTIVAQTDWAVPSKYKNLRNPIINQTDFAEQGKKLYNAHCMSCHGNMGNGNGLKATTLTTPFRSLSAAEVQNQTDGEIYYKIVFGRNEMPNFERRIPNEEERWLIINYIRTLKN